MSALAIVGLLALGGNIGFAIGWALGRERMGSIAPEHRARRLRHTL